MLGLALAPTAFVMLVTPNVWYENFPGVAERGAFNGHFVRDLGCVFVVVSAVFLRTAWTTVGASGLVLAATSFLVLHASVHLTESLAGAHHLTTALLMADIFGAYAPAVLAGWISFALWARSRGRAIDATNLDDEGARS